MNEAIPPGALASLFTGARTHNGWQAIPVSDETLREIYDLMKWGPTSANCSPARIVFVRSAEGKEKLRPALSSGNLEKTLTAPVTAIVAWGPHVHPASAADRAAGIQGSRDRLYRRAVCGNGGQVGRNGIRTDVLAGAGFTYAVQLAGARCLATVCGSVIHVELVSWQAGTGVGSVQPTRVADWHLMVRVTSLWPA